MELSGLTLETVRQRHDHARYDETVRGADVFLIQSVAGTNVNDMLMELLIATDAAKRASARSITAVITHYGYARQDRKAGPRERAHHRPPGRQPARDHPGVDRIITLEPAPGSDANFFDIPVNHLSRCRCLPTTKRDELRTDNLVVVSPDVLAAPA